MWEQVQSNQTRSAVLVVVMGILLLFVGYALGYAFLGDGITGVLLALLLWAIMNLVAYFQGDSILLALAQAKKINRDDHPRLYNIVEEMKIASGLEKMPDIYIMDDPAINAFATGRDQNRASLCVTAGLLQKLNRDELQGVIGHEMAHIRNRDVLLMAMCSVLLGTIVILAWYGSRAMLFGGMGGSRRDSSSGGGGAQIIILVVAVILMILAPIMAQLIYFAISRKREYLADASSALYTRYPLGLASALEKIASSTVPLKTANQATAPMYILNPFRKKGMAAADLTSTHPPISERIRILRSMGGASFLDYNKAYSAGHGSDRGVIPPSALATTETVQVRQPSVETAADPGETARARETSSVLWQKNNFTTVNCECGTKFRIPPGFEGAQFTCPHCGRINYV